MVKKATKKAVKKTAKKSKVSSSARTKSTPFKSKLGHDPLAWISGEDASELGIAYDTIGSETDISDNLTEEQNQQQTIDQLDRVFTQAHENSDVVNSTSVDNVEDSGVIDEAEAKAESETDVAAVADDGSWGLFDDDPVVAAPAIAKEATVSDDGSWGLFGIGDENDDLPIGEGVAWGLFSEDQESDATVESDAVIIHLPVAFVVNDINKVFHEFEEVVHKHKDVIVDASQVETIDASGLQLLYAGRKELLKRDCKMVIKDASERIQLLSKSTFIYEMIGIAV